MPQATKPTRRRAPSVALSAYALGCAACEETFLRALLGAASVLFSLPAAANGRFPLSNQIVFSQTDPNLVVVRTSYGILPSHDNGKTWGYICEDAIGISPSTLANPAVALTHNNSLIVGLTLGLNVSPDVGCNWSCIGGPLAGQSIADVAVRPDNPSGAVAVTSTYLPSDSGTLLNNSQVFETADDGKTWAPLGVALDPHVVVATVDVSKSDPQRLYVSGTRRLRRDEDRAPLRVVRQGPDLVR